MQEKNLECGLLHVALYVSDYDRSAEFYQKALGCTFVRQWGNPGKRVGVYDFGNGTAIELFEESPQAHGEPNAQCPGALWHLALWTTDVDAAFARAVAAGAMVRNEPYDCTHDSIPKPVHSRNAFVFGPDHELIEFYRLRD